MVSLFLYTYMQLFWNIDTIAEYVRKTFLFRQSKTKILQVVTSEIATQIPTFFSLFILCGRVQYTCTLYNRVSQYVTNFRFFKVFITSQAHLRPKVLKKAICCRSLPNLQAEIDCCANCLAVTKLYKIESQLFAVRFLCQGYSKANFTISLLKHTVFELLYLKILIFCPKGAKDIKKFKTKAIYENSPIKLDLKCCQIFANIFSWTSYFSKLGIFMFTQGQNTILT